MGGEPALASISQASDKESRVIHADEYKRMYDRSAIGTFRYALDGRYLMANPAGVRLHGYDSETELLRAVGNVSDEVREDLERPDRQTADASRLRVRRIRTTDAHCIPVYFLWGQARDGRHRTGDGLA